MMPQERQAEGQFVSNDIRAEGVRKTGGLSSGSIEFLLGLRGADILSHCSEGCFYYDATGCAERAVTKAVGPQSWLQACGFTF